MSYMPINAAEDTTATTTAATMSAGERAPRQGERCCDLVFDTAASPTRPEGLWIYPACYDDWRLARRRAASLSRAFGVAFQVDLFGATAVATGTVTDATGLAGERAISPAVDEPGYYAFTLADPRPHAHRLAIHTTEVGAAGAATEGGQGR